MKVVVPFVLIFAGLAALIAMGVTQGGIPELQVEQVLAGEYPDREVKVHGFLGEIESAERPLRFMVKAKESDVVMEVVCDKSKPDTFQEDYDVAVQGHWDAEQNHFVAEQIFTKCPSKYEAEAKEGIGSPQMGYEKPTDTPAGTPTETPTETPAETSSAAPAADTTAK